MSSLIESKQHFSSSFSVLETTKHLFLSLLALKEEKKQSRRTDRQDEWKEAGLEGHQWHMCAFGTNYLRRKEYIPKRVAITTAEYLAIQKNEKAHFYEGGESKLAGKIETRQVTK